MAQSVACVENLEAERSSVVMVERRTEDAKTPRQCARAASCGLINHYPFDIARDLGVNLEDCGQFRGSLRADQAGRGYIMQVICNQQQQISLVGAYSDRLCWNESSICPSN